MKYFEFTFRTQPCTETVNDVLAAILGEVGFESFVECEGGLTAYIQQTLCDENAIKIAINEFPLPDTDITYTYTDSMQSGLYSDCTVSMLSVPRGQQVNRCLKTVPSNHSYLLP